MLSLPIPINPNVFSDRSRGQSFTAEPKHDCSKAVKILDSKTLRMWLNPMQRRTFSFFISIEKQIPSSAIRMDILTVL